MKLLKTIASTTEFTLEGAQVFVGSSVPGKYTWGIYIRDDRRD